MKFPDNLKYTKDHEWVKIENNIATIGITDFAQSELGDIVFVEIETEGEDIDKNEIFGTIEAVKTVSDMYMPVTGNIKEVNPNLEDTPEIVNKDPYGEGWMIKIEMSNESEISELLSVGEYKELVNI